MSDFAIPEPAASILDEIAPVLLSVWTPEQFVIGGGTALAA